MARPPSDLPDRRWENNRCLAARTGEGPANFGQPVPYPGRKGHASRGLLRMAREDQERPGSRGPAMAARGMPALAEAQRAQRGLAGYARTASGGPAVRAPG